MTFLKKKYYPLLIAGTLRLFVVTLLLMSDSIIAGLFIGEDAVAGINLVTPLYSLSYFFGGLVSIGVPILYSNAMGRYDKKEADSYFGNGLTAATVIGILLFIPVMFFGDYWLQFCQPTQAVLNQARPYLFWYSFVILILPVTTFMVEMVLADGDDSICTLASIIQVLGNIILSIILCKMIGIAGIGIGTLAGTGLALLACFIHLAKNGNSLHPNIAFSCTIVAAISKYSAIDAGSYLFLALYSAVLNWFVPWMFGSQMLILVSVIMFVKELQLIFDGIGEAITPIMSVYLGEGSYEGIRKCWKIAKRSAIVEGLGVSVTAILIAPLIVSVFGISDPDVTEYSITGIIILSLGLTFTGLMYLLTSYYLVRNKILLGLGLSALRDVVAAAPLVIIGGISFGIYGIMAGASVSCAVAYIASLVYISLRYGKDNCPLLLNELEKIQKYGYYELLLTPDNIVGTVEKVDRMLKGFDVPENCVNKAAVLIEDMFMLVREKNDNRTVYAECTVIIKEDGVQILTKDNGVLFDLTEDDMKITSLRAYLVSGISRNLTADKNNLTTMGCNRNVFYLEY